MTEQDSSIRIVRSVHFNSDSRWNYKINLYPYNTFYFVLGGDGHVQVGSAVTDLRPGYVYLIPSNTLYSCWCQSAIRKLYVEATVETIPGKDVFHGFYGVRELPFGMERIEEMVARNGKSARDRLWFHGEFEKAVSLFLDEEQPPLDPEMLRFKRMLDDVAVNLSADLRLKDIAQKYGWHPSALSRSFHRAFHCGLKHYVDLLLMNRLKQDLITRDVSLQALAGEYRFCDAYYLSAFFKKRAGSSPTLYRRQFVRDREW